MYVYLPTYPPTYLPTYRCNLKNRSCGCPQPKPESSKANFQVKDVQIIRDARTGKSKVPGDSGFRGYGHELRVYDGLCSLGFTGPEMVYTSQVHHYSLNPKPFCFETCVSRVVASSDFT